jgi:hypothetical protein
VEKNSIKKENCMTYLVISEKKIIKVYCGVLEHVEDIHSDDKINIIPIEDIGYETLISDNIDDYDVTELRIEPEVTQKVIDVPYQQEQKIKVIEIPFQEAKIIKNDKGEYEEIPDIEEKSHIEIIPEVQEKSHIEIVNRSFQVYKAELKKSKQTEIEINNKNSIINAQIKELKNKIILIMSDLLLDESNETLKNEIKEYKMEIEKLKNQLK